MQMARHAFYTSMFVMESETVRMDQMNWIVVSMLSLNKCYRWDNFYYYTFIFLQSLMYHRTDQVSNKT